MTARLTPKHPFEKIDGWQLLLDPLYPADLPCTVEDAIYSLALSTTIFVSRTTQ